MSSMLIFGWPEYHSSHRGIHQYFVDWIITSLLLTVWGLNESEMNGVLGHLRAHIG